MPGLQATLVAVASLFKVSDLNTAAASRERQALIHKTWNSLEVCGGWNKGPKKLGALRYLILHVVPELSLVRS